MTVTRKYKRRQNKIKTSKRRIKNGNSNSRGSSRGSSSKKTRKRKTYKKFKGGSQEVVNEINKLILQLLDARDNGMRMRYINKLQITLSTIYDTDELNTYLINEKVNMLGSITFQEFNTKKYIILAPVLVELLKKCSSAENNTSRQFPMSRFNPSVQFLALSPSKKSTPSSPSIKSISSSYGFSPESSSVSASQASASQASASQASASQASALQSEESFGFNPEYVIKDAGGQGDCFYFSVYEALKESNLLAEFQKKYRENINIDDKRSFVQSFRLQIGIEARKNTQKIDGIVSTMFQYKQWYDENQNDEKKNYKTFENYIDKLYYLQSWLTAIFIKLIKDFKLKNDIDYLNNGRAKEWMYDHVISMMEKRSVYVQSYEVEFSQKILEKANISLVVKYPDNLSDLHRRDPITNRPNIYIINNNHNHFRYISFIN